MRWKRKTPMWPAAAALLGLLVLTLIAPRAWIRSDVRPATPRTLASNVAPPQRQLSQPATEPARRPTADARVETPVTQEIASDKAPPPLPPLHVEHATPAPRYVRPGAEHMAPNPDLIAPVAAPIVAGDDYADDYEVLEASTEEKEPVADRDELAVVVEPVVEADVEVAAADQAVVQAVDEDYVVVDQPMPELPSIEADPPLQLTAPTFDVTGAEDVADAGFYTADVVIDVAESDNGPVEVETEPVIEPPAPSIDPETFAKAQAALEELLWQAQEAVGKIDFSSVQPANEQPKEKLKKQGGAVPPPSRLVRVDSPNDRLAMAPERSILRETQDQATPLLAQATKPHANKEPVDTTTVSKSSPQKPLVVTPPRPAFLEHPSGLISQLLTLRKYGPAKDWADAALDQISKLSSEPPGAIAVGAWKELERLAEIGSASAADNQDPEIKTYWVRATLSLHRRLPLWRALVDPDQETATTAPSRDASDLTAALHEIASLTANAEPGSAWRAYLLLDSLADLATAEPNGDAVRLQKTAGRVLARMTDARLTSEQRAFLRTAPLAALRRSLEPWASGPVRLDILAAVVERYEATGSMRYAKAIAQHNLRLQWSGDPEHILLAEHLNRVYRQPNLRIAVSGDFMNRLVPEPKPMTAPVRDRVGGADIRGRSHTTTDLSVRLLPDSQSWRIALAAEGDVRSRTYSDTWPARVKNAGRLKFDATKEIVLTPSGLAAKPTAANVRGQNRMIGVDSEFDPIPLLGTLVRNIARQKHDRNRVAALAQVKTKVARAAENRLDEATSEKLEDLELNFRAKVLAPLEQLAVNADPVDMFTTEKRAVMRLRMAGEQQLAAYTPRPSAPSDSLISMQTHESSLNNALEGLGLDGRRMAATELYGLLAKKFTGSKVELPEGLSSRTKIQFAKHDSVRVAYQDDRLELLLSIAELARGRDRIRDFQVHAFYEPVIDGMQVDLVRHGTLQFSGPRLRTGPRVALHSVFGKLLHKAHAITIVNEQVENDSRLEGLMVTQLVLDDGWLAVALGPTHPSRMAWRTRVPKLRR